MTSYSHTKLSTFEQCPQKYKFGYVDKVETAREDTVEAFLGQRVHEALEKLYRDLQFENHPSVEELLVFFNKIWKEGWNSQIVINKKEYTQENYRKMGERFLEDYHMRHHPFKDGKVIGIETEEYYKLDDKRKYSIRIDRIVDKGKGVYEVHDYKTNSRLPLQEDLDDDRQLAMYSLWVHEQFKDAKKVTLVWHFLAFDKDMRSERTPTQLRQLKQNVLLLIKKIEGATSYPTKVSALCNYCEYQPICPAWKHSVQIEKKAPNEYLKDGGVKLVNKFAKVKHDLKEYDTKAEAELEKLKEALIAFAKKKGVEIIFGSDNKVSVKECSSVSFPAKHSPERDKLIATLKKLNLYNKVVDLDTFALKHLLEELSETEPGRVAKISKFMSETKDYRVSLSKKRSDED